MGAQVDSRQLLEAAWQAREKAYSEYSKFSVGAAIQTGAGHIFKGCNVENISFGLTICAERGAAMAAVVAGERTFEALAIVAETTVSIVPCGACRQFLAEFNPSLKIYSAGKDRKPREWSLAQLLPSPNDGILDNTG